jgi:hypothetical protein
MSSETTEVPDWATLSEKERAVAASKQTAFIQGCYDHAAKLRAGSIRPYSGLLGHGHDLSDEARRDIDAIRTASRIWHKMP